MYVDPCTYTGWVAIHWLLIVVDDVQTVELLQGRDTPWPPLQPVLNNDQADLDVGLERPVLDMMYYSLSYDDSANADNFGDEDIFGSYEDVVKSGELTPLPTSTTTTSTTTRHEVKTTSKQSAFAKSNNVEHVHAKDVSVTIMNSTSKSLSVSWRVTPLFLKTNFQHAVTLGRHVNIKYQVWYWADKDVEDVQVKSTYENTLILEDLVPGALYNIWLMGVQANRTLDLVTFRYKTKPIVSAVFSAKSVSTTQLTLSYSAPSNADVFDVYIVSLNSSTPSTQTKTRDDMDREVVFPGLEPGTYYSVTVRARSGSELSDSIGLGINTVPEPPLLTCIPEERSFSLQLRQQRGAVQSYVTVCTGPGYNNGPVTLTRTGGFMTQSFTGLSPHTYYTFVAWSVLGGKNSANMSTPDTCKTGQAAPGPVDALRVGPGVRPYELTLVWGSPPSPNGVLTGYTIVYSGVKQGKPNDAGRSFTLTNQETSKKITNLKAGYTYVFSVRGKTVYPGEPTNITQVMPIEAPKTVTVAAPEHRGKLEWNQFQVQLVNPFNDLHGDVVSYSIIVIENQDASQHSKTTEISRTWQQAVGDQSLQPYAAVYKCPQLFPGGDDCWRAAGGAQQRRRRATAGDKVTVTIGGQSDCGAVSTSQHCNGALLPDKTYLVFVQGFTQNGLVSNGPLSVAIATASKPFPMWAIIVIVVAVLLVLVVVLVVVLVRRRRTYKDSGGYDNGIPLRPEEEKAVTNRPVETKKFSEHCALMAMNSGLEYADEYDQLKPVGREQPFEDAELQENRVKNRFTNILPYDHSRVKLLPTDDEPGSDYTNANWMPGYNSKREFIVCQGPLPATRDDFWRMTWEYSCRAIVMLARCVENGRERVDHYWPVDKEPMYYGDLQVQILNETHSPHFTVMEFRVSQGDQARKVIHFHYLVWPDFSVPAVHQDLIRFVRLVRTRLAPEGGPLVVHCSAGVGRSGTFIVLDRLLQHILHHNKLDIYGIVYEMRQYRPYMVQTETQYIFIHECMEIVLEGRENEIKHTNAGLENQGFDDKLSLSED